MDEVGVDVEVEVTTPSEGANAAPSYSYGCESKLDCLH